MVSGKLRKNQTTLTNTGEAKTMIKIQYVDRKRDRKRQWLYYFRRNRQRWRLPGQPETIEFVTEYQRLLKLTSSATALANVPFDKRSFAPGTFGRLVNDYLNSSEFKFGKKGKQPLGERTKAEYKRVLEKLQSVYGH